MQKYEIDCRGLTVLTEAASGAYLFNPMIPLLGGADRVITFCKNSRYAGTEEVEESMNVAYDEVGLLNRYEFRTHLDETTIGSADIVTNSGHLRPFKTNFIEKMKNTAVLPLMWESWEFRPEEIDLDTARRRGILIMGTNEHQAPCDLRPYSFLTALHLAMSHKASIIDDRILVIGDQYTLAQPIVDGFHRLNIACRRISPTCVFSEATEAAAWATYIIVAEHANHRLLLGPGGLIDTQSLVKANTTGVGVVSGLVDRDHLEQHGISVYPEQLAPPGFMSYMPSELGPYSVMDLFAAGIKVGQVMTRARQSGMSVTEAARHTLMNSPAMDLEGGRAWI
ncbi:MAG: hypothetical protein KF804_07485 [Burkholderiales bacterium]|nr:hypothetical protein [Burkholderiales bacterium]